MEAGPRPSPPSPQLRPLGTPRIRPGVQFRPTATLLVYNLPAMGETVTILFTDLVGSTELLQRAGDERAQRIFRAHHKLLREALDVHGGHEVKWLGDGLMVAFPSAGDALRCAIQLQQASRRPTEGERLHVRVGLNVGEALREETDYFGTPVVIARRLCDRGEGGQILASELVVRLLEGRDEFVFRRLGELELRGINEPVPAVEALYEHDPLALLARTPFVGRREEMAALEKAFASVRGGRGAIAMLAGEPGIGKTRLAEEFGEAARAAGAVIALGGCYEGDISVPYRPWVEALRSYANGCGDKELREQMGPGAPEVATLLPELRERFSHIREAPRLEPEAERLRLFDSITQFVRRAAQSQPLVLFLDDLHWADKPSLLLLQHLARGVTSDRVLVLGTYRDSDVGRTHPLAEALAELRRRDHYQRLPLRGLPEETVDELLAAIEPSEELVVARQALAAALHHETEGNPFFIREVLSHLIETGKLVHEGGRWASTVANVEELGIPEGVREVIGRRVSRLTEGCNRMLIRASALTGGFTWDVLKAVCAEPEGQLLDQLDEALAAQLLQERRDTATYDFTHALIRHTLYDELSVPRRVLFHSEIGGALEKLYAGNLDAHLAELANHFSQAAPTGFPSEGLAHAAQKAVDYCTRAGDRAMSLFAWEEAAQHYERALQTVEAGGGPDEAWRCGLLLKLGETQSNAAQVQPALEAYRRAGEAARRAGDPERLALAAVGFEEAGNRVFGDTGLRREALTLLDEAIARLGEVETAQRVRALIARLRPAAALSGGGDLLQSGGFGAWAGAKDPALLLQARQALAMAERLGDPGPQAAASFSLVSLMFAPGNAEERLDLASKQVQLARQAGDLHWELWGSLWRMIALLELGEVAAFRLEFEEYGRRAQEARLHVEIALATAGRAALAIAEGRFEEAERLIFEAFQHGQESGSADAGTAFGAQLYNLRRLQGRIAEVESIFREAAEGSPSVATYRAALAYLYADLGMLDESRDQFERLAARNFSDIPQDFLWMITMSTLTDTCAALGDAERAEQLYSLLLPYASLSATVAHVLSVGSVSLSLGQLATVLQRWQDAERHFEHAIEMNARMGFSPWVAMTQLSYGQMLLRRGAPDDHEKARALLGEALEAAERMGMAKVASDCRALLEQPQD